jgi:hypothetical protein
MNSRAKARSFSPRHRLANRPLAGLCPSWRTENVEHGLARLRSNNPQMIMPRASPPHRLGAHDRVAPFMSQRAQPRDRKGTHGSTCSRLNCDNGTDGQEGAQTLLDRRTQGRHRALDQSISDGPLQPADNASAKAFCDVDRGHLIQVDIDFFGDLLAPFLRCSIRHRPRADIDRSRLRQ